jgi:hypothetical protein
MEKLYAMKDGLALAAKMLTANVILKMEYVRMEDALVNQVSLAINVILRNARTTVISEEYVIKEESASVKKGGSVKIVLLNM